MESLRRYLLLGYLFIGYIFTVNAQDVQFSQFYAAQTFLNPGFAGGAHAHRVMLQQRAQWPSLDSKYLTSLLSYDMFSQKYRSGFGVIFLYDHIGTNRDQSGQRSGKVDLKSTELHLQYSYELPISKKFTVRPGLQLGLISKRLEGIDLTVPHQYSDDGILSSSNGYSQLNGASKMYPDVGAGMVFYSDEFWFSTTGNHLNLPNQSLIGEVARLPMKLAFASGYKIHLKQKRRMAAYANKEEEVSITPVAHYKFQGKSDQADVGTYFIYNQLLTGMWYRGIPFKRYEKGLQNNESLVFILGWMYNNWSFSYSYDFTLSRLRPASTRGAHEFNVTYIHHHRKGNKVRKRLPCPTFYKNHL